MNKVCVVMGVGPGNGEAFVRRFCGEGFQVAMLARSQDYLKQLEQSVPGAHAFACDLMEPAQITSALADIESRLGAVSVMLYNAGGGVFKSVEGASLEDFEANWQIPEQYRYQSKHVFDVQNVHSESDLAAPLRAG